MQKSELDTLRATLLFSGISTEEIGRLCRLLHAGERHYAKGSFLITAGDPISAFALLLSGAVQVFMNDMDGNRIVMANVTPGTLFAEALACSDVSESPIYAVSTQESTVLWLQSAFLSNPAFFADPLCARFGANFIRSMADRSLRFNDRVQILSKKSIRDKLITFFSQQIHQQKSRQIVIDMDRSALADYLGVERSALSRELSRMQHAGILQFHKNHFTIFHT
mgnify:CR=1 FL=1